ncbi:MAG: sigma-70 family RNA polymerase sigma factor [Gemmatimonadota bacterium]|nr:sigma-70 family RNA polymerase sigma factor [Gemmatimonadota bacterium]
MSSGPEPDAPSSFEAEALPWLDAVHRFALSMTRDEADADDVVQETYLRAFRSWRTFLAGSDCRRWLFTICRNVFLRSKERERSTVDVSAPEVETLAAVRLHAEAMQSGADSLLDRADLGPAISRAIGELPEPYRVAVVLVDVEGQSYDEAAEIMGVPVGTVRSRLFRGRRRLQEALFTHARDAGFDPPSLQHEVR